MTAPTLLIVDDDPIIVEILERLLRARGYALLRADSVATGKQLASEHPELSAAIVDLGLADGSGWTLVEWLRAERPGMAVLVMSGDPPADDEGGRADACISKPFPPDLVDRIDGLLGRGANADALPGRGASAGRTGPDGSSTS